MVPGPGSPDKGKAEGHLPAGPSTPHPPPPRHPCQPGSTSTDSGENSEGKRRLGQPCLSPKGAKPTREGAPGLDREKRPPRPHPVTSHRPHPQMTLLQGPGRWHRSGPGGCHLGISRPFLAMSAPTSPHAPARGIGRGGLASAAVTRRNLKRSVFHPPGSPASVSPPVPARTPAGSAPGSSGLGRRFSFDKKAWRRRGAATGDPSQHLRPGEPRVPAARPPRASASPTGRGNKAAGRPGAPGPARGPRSRPAGWAAAASCAARGDLGRYCTC